MTTVELIGKSYTIPVNGLGLTETVGECFDDDLWSCSQLGISGIREDIKVRGSTNRTIGGRIRRDILGSYKTFTINYEMMPIDRYNKLKNYLRLQDCCGMCLELSVTANCGECECIADNFYGYVVMELSGTDFIEGGFVEGVTVTFTESSGDCEEC